MPTSLSELIRMYDDGSMPKLLCFWRPTAAPSGQLGAECFSQWHESSFEIDGVRFKTAEHWMMAEKARLFGDADKRAAIIAADHPGKAQRLGREVRGFEIDVWTEHRSEIVTIGNVAKFDQNPELGAYLAASRDRVLVEASPRDRIWGIGLEAKDDRTQNPRLWLGLNLLGFALMDARSRLAAA